MNPLNDDRAKFPLISEKSQSISNFAKLEQM